MPRTSVKISQACAFRAAASATAVVSDPPRPSVVTSISVPIPWKPATTTTSYPAPWLAATRRAARLIRPGVPRELPPNFWTRIGLVTVSGSADNKGLPGQPFRQEDRALAGAELGVVREHHVFHAVERRLVADPADRDRHAVARISVAAGLGPERVGIDAQQLVGRGGEAPESVDAESLHRGGGRCRVGRALGADEHGFQVPVRDIDAGTGAGHRQWG